MAASPESLWYKDAIIYQLHVRTFCDSNGDGIGDFPGLMQKLDYLQELGVNVIWLLPFFPSPLRDDGYDISTIAVHPSYGLPKTSCIPRTYEEGCGSSLSWFSTTLLTSTPGSRNRAALARIRSAIGTSGATPMTIIKVSELFSSTQKGQIGRGIRSRSPIIGIDSSVISLT